MVIVIDAQFLINIVRRLSFDGFECIVILFVIGTHFDEKISNMVEFMMHRLVKTCTETICLSAQ
jgi:hypothetical protein